MDRIIKKEVLFILMLVVTFSKSTYSQKEGMKTRWFGFVPSNDLYPRPQLQRSNWTNLNGKWQYVITDTLTTQPVFSKDSIIVPFPIESMLSGVQKTIYPNQLLWYRRVFTIDDTNESYLLNFGAVDYFSSVFINGKFVGSHSGGYLPFGFDISKFIHKGENEIIVKVADPTDTGVNPHGKQALYPENIYYTSSTGIWQTVWLEHVSRNHVRSIKTTPNIDEESVEININLTTTDRINNLKVQAVVRSGSLQIAKKTIAIVTGENESKFILNIPNARLWSPEDPHLYTLSVTLISNEKTLDNVESYFGMRKIDIQKDEKGMDRIFLNNRYTYNLGTLDQGFWPDGLYTAPSDDALSYDIKAIKQMGFNTIRKHIKVEPERWYYYADKLGILVWQDFVNPPHGLPEGSRAVFEKEIKETVDHLYNHPSIVTWVLFNEGWGAYDQKRLTKWIKIYDPSRLVNGHSGEMLFTDNHLRSMPNDPWVNSDMVDIHSYPFPRNTPSLPGKAKVIGEFGGIGVSVNNHEWNDMQGWGYVQVNARDLITQYRRMTDSLKYLERNGLSASIYTQPFDVEGEENGLITYDREIIKLPLDSIRLLNQILARPTREITEPNFFIAHNLDVNDNDGKFEELLVKYKNGDRDSSILRRLILTAYRQKNQELVTQIGKDFISCMSAPFSKSNLIFIKYITRTPQDTGFQLFLNNVEKIDLVMGKNVSRNTIKDILKKSVVPEYKIDTTRVYDWNKLEKDISEKYGEIGEETILGRIMIEYSGLLGNIPDWEKFGKYYVLYFQKALEHPEFNINAISWPLFEHVTDPTVLTFATKVVKYSIDNWDRSPEILDTYANLLHKTQQTQKAIEWESKALELTKGTRDEKLFAETLQKMKDNKPTWPQN
ncbi:Glycosyl hydrolases family 2, TIM barrel domain [Chitinophaga terrae (ex Kim and Jung 2007)]|uniref:Glycosyl hydrolases family 2, TIM barrel domain n=1 Tax=Chitinophaga terrae (ex Kim and Jung 2007) TaxID=408074 RepID=A0A1H3X725_9BACT|nr:sugar-binding domain-containing protein [Chitinophaga terrae (ex Kim and Jung 2007)]GEP89885.1 hypothetical protein CTE07_15300 [Chitinophaga terrae (ex Kim and Jung 2007)]SDZ95176.1 Glycosyl hydrolases family 2, TIM barrel domain [Chitinophaga terrae (ex Kim and Jung 2007)]